MPNRYASGKWAIACCDYCGFQYKLKELRSLVIKTKNVNILVCQTCWEPDQPQLQIGMYPIDDPQALRNPRPDTTYTQGGLTGLQLLTVSPPDPDAEDAFVLLLAVAVLYSGVGIRWGSMTPYSYLVWWIH